MKPTPDLGLPPPRAKWEFDSALLGGLLIWSVASLLQNILPIIFHELAREQRLSAEHVGYLGAAFTLGAGLANASSPLWIARASWRAATMRGLAVSAALLLVIAGSSRFDFLAGEFFMLGLALGTARTPSFRALGDAADPARIFGLLALVSSGLAALAVIGVPYIASWLGTGALFCGVSLLTAATIPLARLLPPMRKCGAHGQGGKTSAEPSVPSSIHGAAILAALAGAIHMGGVLAISYFIPALAVIKGIDEPLIGPLVGLGFAAAMVGAVIPSLLGRKFRASTILAATIASVILIAFPMMMIGGAWLFVAGYWLFAIGWGPGYSYFLAIVRQIDAGGRVYVATPALQAAGGAMGAGLGGFILSRFGMPCLLILSSCLLLAALAFGVAAQRYACDRGRASVSEP